MIPQISAVVSYEHNAYLISINFLINIMNIKIDHFININIYIFDLKEATVLDKKHFEQ